MLGFLSLATKIMFMISVFLLPDQSIPFLAGADGGSSTLNAFPGEQVPQSVSGSTSSMLPDRNLTYVCLSLLICKMEPIIALTSHNRSGPFVESQIPFILLSCPL